MTLIDPPKRRGRGRPKKVRLPRRPRATTPFLPVSAEAVLALPAKSPLRRAMTALPDVPVALEGVLELADLPTNVPGVRFALTEAQEAAAQRVLKAMHDREIQPYADNSRRSIRADWRHWIAFCAVKKKVAMPIATDDLQDFLDALIAASYQRATLEHLIFTLTLASQLWDCPSPTDHLAFRWFWKDRRRTKLVRRQHQAAALNFEDLDALADQTDPDDPRAVRDHAFVAVAYDLLARASELVALRWVDVNFGADPAGGGANATIGRSKTDQEGTGATRYLQPETVRLLRAWESHRFPENAYVFHALPRYADQPMDRARPLAVREASRIFARVSERAGTGKSLSAHSARVGGAQDMTRAGMELPAIMHMGRWTTPSMPARYAANELATRAGKGRAAALAKLRRKES